jgi:hypothetical protein
MKPQPSIALAGGVDITGPAGSGTILTAIITALGPNSCTTLLVSGE